MAPKAAHYRVHARRAIRLRASLVHHGGGWENEAGVLNLGLGGACVLFDGAVSPGDPVTIHFLAPTLWDPLAFPARVVWSLAPDGPAGTRAGLAFEPSDPSAVYALFELLTTMSF